MKTVQVCLVDEDSFGQDGRLILLVLAACGTQERPEAASAEAQESAHESPRINGCTHRLPAPGEGRRPGHDAPDA